MSLHDNQNLNQHGANLAMAYIEQIRLSKVSGRGVCSKSASKQPHEKPRQSANIV